jgi:hypothetical protein
MQNYDKGFIRGETLDKLVNTISKQSSIKKIVNVKSIMYEYSGDILTLVIETNNDKLIILEGKINKEQDPPKVTPMKPYAHGPRPENKEKAMIWNKVKKAEELGNSQLSKEFGQIVELEDYEKQWGLDINKTNALRKYFLNITMQYIHTGEIDFTYYGGKRSSKKTRKARNTRKGTYRRRR